MEKKGYSRRDFLATFAALSAAPFFACAFSGCAYGPAPLPPIGRTIISGLYYLDAQSDRISLFNAEAVPVLPTIIIDFNAQMNVASVIAALSLTDLSGNGVACAVSADQNAQYSNEVTVIPSPGLASGTTYTLSVSDAAVDADGNHLDTQWVAGTSFKTVV